MKEKIDRQKLKNDREYWDKVAPIGATHFGTKSGNQVCFYRVRGDWDFDFWHIGGIDDDPDWTHGVGNPIHTPLIPCPNNFIEKGEDINELVMQKLEELYETEDKKHEKLTQEVAQIEQNKEQLNNISQYLGFGKIEP